MPEPIRLPDDPTPFRNWLESLPGEQVVCRAHLAINPVETWLMASGSSYADVRIGTYRIDDGDPEPTPLWVGQLLYPLISREGGLTAAECLQLLEEVTR